MGGKGCGSPGVQPRGLAELVPFWSGGMGTDFQAPGNVLKGIEIVIQWTKIPAKSGGSDGGKKKGLAGAWL